MPESIVHSSNGTGEREQKMGDISQDKEACADIYLYTGQRVQPCCVICGREFGVGVKRCVQDFCQCVICRSDYDRYQRAESRRHKIPVLRKQLERLIDEEREDPTKS